MIAGRDGQSWPVSPGQGSFGSGCVAAEIAKQGCVECAGLTCPLRRGSGLLAAELAKNTEGSAVVPVAEAKPETVQVPGEGRDSSPQWEGSAYKTSELPAGAMPAWRITSGGSALVRQSTCACPALALLAGDLKKNELLCGMQEARSPPAWPVQAVRAGNSLGHTEELAPVLPQRRRVPPPIPVSQFSLEGVPGTKHSASDASAELATF